MLYLQTLGCKPIASLDHFQADMMGSADLVEDVQTGTSKVVKVQSKNTPLLQLKLHISKLLPLTQYEWELNQLAHDIFVDWQ